MLSQLKRLIVVTERNGRKSQENDTPMDTPHSHSVPQLAYLLRLFQNHLNRDPMAMLSIDPGVS